MSVIAGGEVREVDGVKLAAAPAWAGAARGVAGRLPADPVAALAVLLGAVIVAAVVANVFRYFQEHLSDKAAILAVNDLRIKTYDHLLHLRLAFYGQRGTSDVTSRLVSDAAQLQDGFKILLGQSIQAPISVGMAFGLALYVDWRLTGFIVVFAPIMLAIIKKFGKKVRRATRASLQKSSAMLGQIEATLAGIRVVKAANAERWERRRYRTIMDGLVEQQLKMSRYEALSTPTMETLTMVVVSCVVLFAAYLVLKTHTLDVGRFFLIMACLLAMGESLRKLSKLNNVIQRANAAAARIFESLDLPAERGRDLRVERGPLRTLRPMGREIVFEDVSFTYPGAESAAVDRVTLRVPKGRSVAIVGRNGSGKTTLLALLPRFYEPTGGRVLIDAVDTAGVSLTSLRRQITLVTQDAVLFPGTVAENIAYGHPQVGRMTQALRAAIEGAARRAFAHEFIVARPGGYDAMLDGLGGGLSGGQRQRLCIARAIFRAAPILILDEATSQVDAESEHLIQKAIEGMIRHPGEEGGVTTFVIAHRFSTILSADEIVVMDGGRVVDSGTHRELLERCVTYQQLYERQLLAPAG